MTTLYNQWYWILATGVLFLASPVWAVDPNLAEGKDSYMVALTDSLNPASYGNDGNLNTAIYSTVKTVDAYWEVDLGDTYALSAIKAVAADEFGDRLNSPV